MAMYTISTSGHEGEFDVFPELLGHIVCMKFEHRVAHAMSGHRLGLLQPRSVLHRLRAQVARHASSSNTNPGSKSGFRSEEHTSELQSLMRISYAVFCLKKKKQQYSISI